MGPVSVVQLCLEEHHGLYCLQLSRRLHCSVQLGEAQGVQKGGVLIPVRGDPVKRCCMAAAVCLRQPISWLDPSEVQEELGVVELLWLQVRAVVAVADDGRPLSWRDRVWIEDLAPEAKTSPQNRRR